MSDQSNHDAMMTGSIRLPDYQAEVSLASSGLTLLTEEVLARRSDIRFEPRPEGVDRVAHCADSDDAIRNRCLEWVREIADMKAPPTVLYFFVRSHRPDAGELMTFVWSDEALGYTMVLRR
ncbi:hypothetical protein H0Z60_17660 [Ectothiorhodospiraceae bacterium WFHF3C12]|nr:hypothetical protein [Ectothiorhodospiraceae bacterium WFHF3C12]